MSSSESKRRSRSQNRNRRRRLAASFESLEARNLLTFAIDLFADINQFGQSSFASDMVELNGDIYFAADDGISGTELWRSDGTAEGTVRIVDILPGLDGSAPSELTVVGNEVFFTALDELDEVDLWKTDGTESGTVKVYDANEDGTYFLENLTESGGKLFFTAYQEATSYELWVSDGTAAGTVLVKDINSDAYAFEGPRELTDVNGVLFFTSYDNSGDNRELWKSDGTFAGTVMVKEIGIDLGDPLDPLDDDPTLGSDPNQLTNINGVLYFSADNGQNGQELFRSGGDAASTVMVADLNPLGDSYPHELTAFNGKVFFVADDGVTGNQLFSSDGNTIELVANTAGGSSESNPSGLTVVGSELFFAAEGLVPAKSLTAVAPALTSSNSRVGSSRAGIVNSVALPNSGVLLAATSSAAFTTTTQQGTNDGPGWVSATATVGTQDPVNGDVQLTTIGKNDLYIQDIDPGDLSVDAWEWTLSDPGGLHDISFTGFASGNEFNDAADGILFELFVNGSATRSGFTEVFGDELDNWFGTRDSGNIDLFFTGGASITTATVRMTLRRDGGAEVFAANSNEAILVNAMLTADLHSATPTLVPSGPELHKTNGTALGTVMVKDIAADVGSFPSQLTESGGLLYFSADDVITGGRELWVSDGTLVGTNMVLDSRPGVDDQGAPLDGDPEQLIDIAGTLFFTTEDQWRDRELWSNSGGTFDLVKDINPTTASANVNSLIPVGNLIYFAANDGIHGEALWVADTVAETVQMVADVTDSPMDNISGLMEFNGKIVFFNDSAGMNGGVYIASVADPAQRISTATPIEFNARGDLFAESNGFIYFVADHATAGEEIWRTDGVADAVMQVDVYSGATSSSPRELIDFNNRLYFTSDDPLTGVEVRSTDGTFVSSFDVNGQSGMGGPPSNSSDPTELTVSGGVLYFTADDGLEGRELWRVNSPSFFSKVADLRAGSGSNPSGLTDVGGTLYFAADNGTDGVEPYSTTGSTASTAQVRNIASGVASSNPSGFFGFGGNVYFAADNGVDGTELWATDATPAGANQVADVQMGAIGSNPEPMIATAQRLLFAANGNAGFDREIWATDGTAAKTILVEDLNPGVYAGSTPVETIEVNGQVFFVADNGLSGRELFRLTEQAPVATTIAVSAVDGVFPVVGATQRSQVDKVSLVFDSVVDIDPASISLRNRNTDTVVTSVQVNQSVQDGQTILELTFGAGPSVNQRDVLGTTGLKNSLADGNYELIILATGVSSIESGRQMAVDLVHGDSDDDWFYRHFGDFDGDRDTDIQDYTRFLSTFRQTSMGPNYIAVFDFEGDGDTDIQDFTQLLGRFRIRRNFI
ncbi:hypothetical protein Pla52nx_003010 [Stieleria varia]|uniref:ELWxxDGT repeat protein n=1 Tax=Stieleria varia TaxID=2528005 RepID=UPI00313E374B